MSIWTWSMWSRFQIGSNSPLANLNARMFRAASLPKKWSIRKIWSSVNAVRRVALSALALRQVGAERLLHDDPRPLGESGLAERAHHTLGGARGDAEVVQSTGPASEVALRLGDSVDESAGTVARARVDERAGEVIPLLVSEGPVGVLIARLAGQLAEHVVVEIVQRAADDPAFGEQSGL